MSVHEAQFYTNRRNDGAVALYNGLVKVMRKHVDRARGKLCSYPSNSELLPRQVLLIVGKYVPTPPLQYTSTDSIGLSIFSTKSESKGEKERHVRPLWQTRKASSR